jgi:hypothetical protein
MTVDITSATEENVVILRTGLGELAGAERLDVEERLDVGKGLEIEDEELDVDAGLGVDKGLDVEDEEPAEDEGLDVEETLVVDEKPAADEGLDVEEKLDVDKEPAADEGLNVEERLDVEDDEPDGVSFVELGLRGGMVAKVERVDEEGEEVLMEVPIVDEVDKTDDTVKLHPP